MDGERDCGPVSGGGGGPLPRRGGHLAASGQRLHRIHAGESCLPSVCPPSGSLSLFGQVSVTLDVYLDGTLFNSIEKDRYSLLKHGREADMV